MALNTNSEYGKVKQILFDVKKSYSGITYTYEVEFQNKPQTQISTNCYGKQCYFKKDLC